MAVNDPAFKAAFPGPAFVAGRFTGALSAVGELALNRVDNSVADTVAFGGAGWPVAAAGQSISVINLVASNDLAANWRAATPSPGATTPVPPTLVCTKTVNGANAVLTFSGTRGSSWEQVRQAPNTWIATVTGLPSFTVTNGAANSFFVRVKGVGFAVPYQDIACR